MDTENSMVITSGKEGWGEIMKGKGGQMYGDRKIFDWAVNTMQYTDSVL